MTTPTLVTLPSGTTVLESTLLLRRERVLYRAALLASVARWPGDLDTEAALASVTARIEADGGPVTDEEQSAALAATVPA